MKVRVLGCVLGFSIVAACAAFNTKVVDPMLTLLSQIGNTGVQDLTITQNVALAATPADTDGASCAKAAIVVNGQINAVFAAANVPNAGAFTVAELASLFQPGSAQYQAASNTIATGCIAKAQDVLGPTGVIAAGGVAGAMVATSKILPLAAAAP